MLIAWTTVSTQTDAEKLARAVVELGLVACVQVDGPITSFYRWEVQTERTAEFRLSLKFVVSQAAAVRNFVLQHHPYSNPEWFVVRAEDVAEKYLSWARANSTNPPL